MNVNFGIETRQLENADKEKLINFLKAKVIILEHNDN